MGERNWGFNGLEIKVQEEEVIKGFIIYYIFVGLKHSHNFN